jgi:hypothetical protein
LVERFSLLREAADALASLTREHEDDLAALRANNDENELLTRELEEAKATMTPFGAWLAFVEAGRSVDGDAPLTDDQPVLTYMGAGASTMITVAQFRALGAFLSRAQPGQDETPRT